MSIMICYDVEIKHAVMYSTKIIINKTLGSDHEI